MRRSKLPQVAGPIVAGIVLMSCTASQSMSPAALLAHKPGFWLGFWHGMIAPITFFVSLFSDTIRIYAVPNSGRWYDFGFMLGIGGWSGSGFLSRPYRRVKAREGRE